MKKKPKSKIAGKLIIGVVISLFLGYGLFLLILKYTGKRTVATITSYRMEKFERNETIRNQYTFVFDYQFKVFDRPYEGRSRVIKGPVYLKNTGTVIPVSYLSCCPRLNAPVRDLEPFYKPWIYIAISGLLLWFMRQL